MSESKEQLKKRIGEHAFRVSQEAETEAPFSGKYLNFNKDGFYHCKVCSAKLFSSNSKTDSSASPLGLQGWPHFSDAVEGAIETRPDNSFNMQRTEILCANCKAHLGHLFEGNNGAEKNFCVNSVCLDFKDKIG